MANLLSGLRLLLAPLLAMLVSRADAADAALAATLFCVGIATDFVDGRLARARGTASAFGRVLDHGADFLFVNAGLAAAAWTGALPWLLPLVVAFAFIQYVVDSYWLHRARELRMSSLGRWNGVLYFVPLGGAIGAQLGVEAAALPTRVVAWLLVASTLASIVDRALAARRPNRPEEA